MHTYTLYSHLAVKHTRKNSLVIGVKTQNKDTAMKIKCLASRPKKAAFLTKSM